jgi:hypothetical protein
MSKIGIACAAGLLLQASAAYAWNDYGHMTIAAVAYNKLTPTARARATALLKLNPDYPKWIAGVPAPDRDFTAFVRAATWPDAIKREGGYVNDGERPSGPTSGQNIGYADKLQHRYWHYIDLPFSPDGTPLQNPVPPNAETQIGVLRRALAAPDTPDDIKSYDLAWLLHLVGDVHQPLHATSRFDQQQPQGDRGGNEVALCAPPCKDELHAFWDDAMGKSERPTDARLQAHNLGPPDAALAAIADESNWVTESFDAAQKSVYSNPIGIGPGPFPPTPRYRKAAHRLALQRAALAGARLANLINGALGAPS